jgi:hypothetical protein
VTGHTESICQLDDYTFGATARKTLNDKIDPHPVQFEVSSSIAPRPLPKAVNAGDPTNVNRFGGQNLHILP